MYRNEEKSTLTGRYLYAVVPAESAEKLSFDTTGINGGEVYPLLAGRMAAIVSDIEPETLRPQRKHLAAHSAVLRKLMDETTALPVAFGIIAGGEQEVRNLLAEQEQPFLAQLDALRGQVEMGLRCRLKGNAFEYFLSRFPDLRAMRDDMFRAGEPSRDQKIELGKYFQELLERVRQETADTVQQGISSVASSTRVNAPHNETELLNLAVLVPREKLDTFRETVDAVASRLDENFEFDLTGPWPTYNFVDLRIHLETAQPQEAH